MIICLLFHIVHYPFQLAFSRFESTSNTIKYLATTDYNVIPILFLIDILFLSNTRLLFFIIKKIYIIT